MQIKCEIKRRRNTKRIVALPQYFSPLENFLEQINLELKVVIYDFFSAVINGYYLKGINALNNQ